MLNSKKFLESFLQKQRFKKVLPFLGKDVLDFGGNRGELRQWVKGIVEHKHYWRKKEIYELASSNGFIIENYSIFQFGFNQFVKLKHRD